MGIETPDVNKAENISFQEPVGFSSFEQEPLDKAWRNLKNGNTISFLTECKSSTDPSHKTIRDGIISGISEASIISQKMIQFNNRPTLDSIIKGAVDGIPTKMRILILKKDECIYTITYVGLDNYYDDDAPSFNKFIEEFKAK